MIDEVDQRLRDWVASVVDGAGITFTAPTDTAGDHVVNLYLLDLLPAARSSSSRRLPLQVFLRYLVTVWDKEPEAAHHALSDLLFAAMEQPDFEVELETVPMQAWLAFGIAPRPAFTLRLPLQLERPEPRVALIRQPIDARVTTASAIQGRVVGPNGIPLKDARVELPALHLATSTDSGGRFQFGAVPPEPPTQELRVRVKGLERSMQIDSGRGARKPIVISIDTAEV